MLGVMHKQPTLNQRVTTQVSALRDSSLPTAVRRCLVVGAGIAAAGSNARTHYTNRRAAAGGEES